MKLLYVVLLNLLLTSWVSAQDIQWISWEEAQSRMKEEPRKVVVDVYTDWCGWCKKLDKTTFKNPEIVNFINDNYYAIKFDAEYKKDIIVNGKSYSFLKTGRRGYHELAAHILRGKMSYPSIVFMDEEMNVIQAIAGFQDVKTFNMILHYFEGDYHKNTPWKTYTRTFKKKRVATYPRSNPSSIEVQTVSNPAGNSRG